MDALYVEKIVINLIWSHQSRDLCKKQDPEGYYQDLNSGSKTVTHCIVIAMVTSLLGHSGSLFKFLYF